MRTEEYKGRTLTICDAENGDTWKYPYWGRYFVGWEETKLSDPKSNGDHGLCSKDDLPALILSCKHAIDLYDDPALLQKQEELRDKLGLRLPEEVK